MASSNPPATALFRRRSTPLGALVATLVLLFLLFPGSHAMATKIAITCRGTSFAATLEDNKAAGALAELLAQRPLTISMRDYGGFEKTGSLGRKLPQQNSRIEAVPGDIMLYNGDTIVVFYGSNVWSYTRLGRIDDVTGLEETIKGGTIPITFTLVP